MKNIKLLLLLLFFLSFGYQSFAIHISNETTSTYVLKPTTNTQTIPPLNKFENFYGSNIPTADTGKNQLVAALLAYFLGTFGVHNFYLGYKRKGTQQLLLSLGGSLFTIFGGIGIPLFLSMGEDGIILTIISIALLAIGSVMSIIAFVWGFIDFIRIIMGDLKPADGEYAGPDWF